MAENLSAQWLSWLMCWCQILKFQSLNPAGRKKVFRLDNSIKKNKIEINLNMSTWITASKI